MHRIPNLGFEIRKHMLSDNQIWDLLGQEVQVELDTGDSRTKESTVGRLMTRDPASHSLVIAKMGEKTSIETVQWIPGSSVKSVILLESSSGTANDGVDAVIDKYFEADNEGSSGESEEDVQKRALKVVKYLKSHHLDVVEKPKGSYTIGQCVRFERPYQATNLYCDQPIVLKRILKLLDGIE